MASGFCLLYVSSTYPQKITEEPITKTGFFKTIETKLTDSGAKHLIKRIQERGVSFELGDSDKKKLRSVQRGLGQKRLYELIKAIEKNYRSNVAQQPLVMPTPETPKPNLIPVHYGKHPIIYDPNTRTFKEGFADQGLLTMVVEFRNAHERGKEIIEAKDIRAHIYYEPFEFYKNLDRNIPGFAGVDDGVWLEEFQPTINFARGETKTLILAVQSPNGTFAVYDHPIEQREGINIPFPRVRLLTADKYVVKVELTGGTHGEVYEFHVFTITLRPEFNISYG